MRKNEIVDFGWRLFIITFSVALILAVGNYVTADKIERLNIQLQDEARKSVLPDATEFKNITLEGIGQEEYKMVQSVYEGKKDGATVGYTVNVSPNGFGGAIDMIVGIDTDGKITGIKIVNSSETAGLGSKAQEPEFENQFRGKDAGSSLKVIKNGTPREDEIVAISGATITTNAVTDGVNTAANFIRENLLKVKGE